MTKAVGERLMIRANALTTETDFVCIRGGNVLGTAGSVVPLFIRQIRENNEVTLTDDRMTRYFITLEEAIGFVLDAGERCPGGMMFVMKMPTYYIRHIAEALIRHYGDDRTGIRIIGLRPGEKLDEVLVSRNEAHLTYSLGDNDRGYYAILPSTNVRGLHTGKNPYKDHPFEMEEYSSATFIAQSSVEGARALLERSGFLK
jgi:FlaA1/EpsC-like NDP-sugar epimerase